MPVKIEHAVNDDSGEFRGTFQYYFIAGQLWYSDQVYARYIFDSNHLLYWLDEQWRINEMPANNFKDREMLLKTNTEKLLVENEE